MTTLLVGAIALEHLSFLVLEMFFWQKPLGLRVFGNSREDAARSAVLAANQGLYNGFLAAGLIWSLLTQDPAFARALQLFFLSCVAVAGVFGGLTAKRSILLVQAAPALLALALLLRAA